MALNLLKTNDPAKSVILRSHARERGHQGRAAESLDSRAHENAGSLVRRGALAEGATQNRKKLRESAAKRLKSLERVILCAPPSSSLVEAGVRSGLGQRPADFEPKVVHRGLLAHGEVFALRLSFGLLGRARDVDGDLRLDLGM